MHKLKDVVRSLSSQLQIHWTKEAESKSQGDCEAKIEEITVYLDRHVKMTVSRSGLLVGYSSIPTNPFTDQPHYAVTSQCSFK